MIRRPDLLGLLICAAVAQSIFVNAPLAERALQAREQAEAVRMELPSVLGQLAAARQRGEVLLPFPANQHPAVMLSRLASVGDGVRLSSVSAIGWRSIGGQTCEDLSVSLKGDMNSLCRALIRLEASEPRVGLPLCTLTATEAGAYDMDCRVSYLRDAKADAHVPVRMTAVMDSPSASPAAPVERPRLLLEQSDRLRGVLVTDREAVALVDGRALKAGARFDAEHVIIAVDRRFVDLRRDDGQRVRLSWGKS